MKMKNSILFVSVVFFLSSCASTTPETIVGIQLGINPNQQIEHARNSGLLLTDNGDVYLPLADDIKGYTDFWTMYDHTGNNILHTVWVRFSGKHHGRHDPVLSEAEKNELVNLYENKYGVCRPWKEGDDIEGNKIKSGPTNSDKFYHYMWKKGHLVIDLSFLDADNYPGQYTGVTIYEFDSDYKNGLEEKVKEKKNDGI